MKVGSIWQKVVNQTGRRAGLGRAFGGMVSSIEGKVQSRHIHNPCKAVCRRACKSLLGCRY